MSIRIYERYPQILMVIEAVRNGLTFTRACSDLGLSPASIRRCILHDEDLVKMIADAETEGTDTLADMLVDIDQYHPDPKMAAVISKNIQWLLERRNRTKYGARVQVDHNNSPDRVIAEALAEAIKRIPVPALPAVTPPMIDVTPNKS